MDGILGFFRVLPVPASPRQLQEGAERRGERGRGTASEEEEEEPITGLSARWAWA